MIQLIKAIPLIGGLVKTIFGDKAAREQAAHGEQMGVLNQFAAEFRDLSHRTWWDSFIDGLNRLPRPIMTFGTIWLFWYCVADPAGFAESATALQAMPEMGWWVLITIIGFWFGTKTLERLPNRFDLPDIPKINRTASQAPEIAKAAPSNAEHNQGLTWDERKEKRYKNDWSNLNG